MASDIEKVRRSESRRGKRPKDLADERKKAIRTYLELGTEEEFVEAMLAAGLHRDDPRFFWLLWLLGASIDLLSRLGEGTFLSSALEWRKGRKVAFEYSVDLLGRLV